MHLEEIQKIIKMLDESSLDELTLEEGDLKITLKRNKEVNAPSNALPAPNFAQPIYTPPQPQPAQQSTPSATSEPTEQTKETASKKYKEIRSPMVGTFYRSPSPEANTYVQSGDKISKGKVLCIIEAMKLMNEIESDVEGTIVDILVENSQPVEYDQVLFLVDPS